MSTGPADFQLPEMVNAEQYLLHMTDEERMGADRRYWSSVYGQSWSSHFNGDAPTAVLKLANFSSATYDVQRTVRQSGEDFNDVLRKDTEAVEQAGDHLLKTCENRVEHAKKLLEKAQSEHDTVKYLADKANTDMKTAKFQYCELGKGKVVVHNGKKTEKYVDKHTRVAAIKFVKKSAVKKRLDVLNQARIGAPVDLKQEAAAIDARERKRRQRLNKKL